MTEQLELPYEVIKSTDIAGRDYLRENFTRASREVYKVPFESLSFRDGFNRRKTYKNIDILADLIEPKTKDGVAGLDEPMVVDILNSGVIFIEKGHRRYKAIELLRTRGVVINFVECYANPKNKTEEQRMSDIYVSNMGGEKLTPLEQSGVVWDLKNNFGKISNEEIAKKLGVSRQTIDNLLILANADDATKHEIENGNLGVSEALAYIRGLKKINKQAEDAEIDANKTSSAPTSLPKDLLADEMKELEELEKEETPEETEQRLLREQTKRDQEREQILEVSDEIAVRKETINEHIGRILSDNVYRTWVEDFVEDETGEVVSIDKQELLADKNTTLDLAKAEMFYEAGVPHILLYKKGLAPIAKSVVTVLPGEDDGTVKYDSSRPEIEKIQKAIQAGDKIEAIVSKLDVPDQTKSDIAYQVHWLQENLQFVRDWVHKNKKQNKAR